MATAATTGWADETGEGGDRALGRLVPVEGALVRHEALGARARAYLADSHAANTRRAYAAATVGL